ncbi:hypothetical protein V8F20_003971 [Naviculisporaceae sp. PSN 640]
MEQQPSPSIPDLRRPLLSIFHSLTNTHEVTYAISFQLRETVTPGVGTNRRRPRERSGPLLGRQGTRFYTRENGYQQHRPCLLHLPQYARLHLEELPIRRHGHALTEDRLDMRGGAANSTATGSDNTSILSGGESEITISSASRARDALVTSGPPSTNYILTEGLYTLHGPRAPLLDGSEIFGMSREFYHSGCRRECQLSI